MQPIMMNGIKLSDPNVQVSQHFTEAAFEHPVHLYRLLSEERINITFLFLDYLNGPKTISCCVEPEKVHHIRNYESIDAGKFECLPGVGLLSVYPHRFNLQSIGSLLSFLGREHHRFHYMASSTATVTFVVDFDAQDHMAGDLAQFMGVPSPASVPAGREYDHIAVSLRKDPETVATYVESKVKTYGIRSRSDLVVCRLDMDIADLAAWGERIGNMAARDLRFCFVSAACLPDDRIRMYLVIDSDQKSDMTARITNVFTGGYIEMVEILPRAAWIGFQGPHFGDRYGIANQAFSALRGHSVPIWLGGCVGAAVSIILPEEKLASAIAALSDNFETPE